MLPVTLVPRPTQPERHSWPQRPTEAFLRRSLHLYRLQASWNPSPICLKCLLVWCGARLVCLFLNNLLAHPFRQSMRNVVCAVGPSRSCGRPVAISNTVGHSSSAIRCVRIIYVNYMVFACIAYSTWISQVSSNKNFRFTSVVVKLELCSVFSDLICHIHVKLTLAYYIGYHFQSSWLNSVASHVVVLINTINLLGFLIFSNSS